MCVWYEGIELVWLEITIVCIGRIIKDVVGVWGVIEEVYIEGVINEVVLVWSVEVKGVGWVHLKR